jgi:hypothetical protein
MPLAPGARLGAYEVLAPLGAGGMGEVYRARDTRLRREVAVKVLPESVTQDKERLRRFEQEAFAASALNHPNILTIHDIGSESGSPFVVFELLEGQTLRERLAAGALPEGQAIEYAVQIANGMAAARPQVNRLRGPARQIFQRQHVRFRQIAHMDVIPYAGAVGSWIFVAENLERGTLTTDGFESRGDEMSLRTVHFADGSSFIRPGGIEVSKVHVAQTVSGAVGLKGLLENQLGDAIGIHRNARQILGHRDF